MPKAKDGTTTVKIQAFGIVTEKPDEFINELEELCKKYAVADNDYWFKYDYEE